MHTSLGSARARRTLARLRAKIVSGDWPINSQIPPEAQLVELFGVGRTTVREAVRSLASLGMLETAPGRGTFVRSRTPVSWLLSDWLQEFDVEEILEYRRMLEVEAARLAAVHRTESDLEALRAALHSDLHGMPAPGRVRVERGQVPGEFHQIVFEAAHNGLMLSLYTGTVASLRQPVARGQVDYATAEADRHREHADLVDAIATGDADRAGNAMQSHLARRRAHRR